MKIIIGNPNITDLLKASTDALNKYDDFEEIPPKIKGQVSLSVIKKLMGADFFSVCAVDNLAKMNEVMFSSEHKEFLDSLHCVDYKDMHEDTREFLFALLVHYFTKDILNSRVR